MGAIEDNIKQQILEVTGFREGALPFRTFIWTEGLTPSRKSLVAWKTLCKPRAKGGYNLTDLNRWNTVTMLKLLWDLRKKIDCLWVTWMHSYFIKGKDLMQMNGPSTPSWISKGILKARHDTMEIQARWDKSLLDKKFTMGEIYRGLLHLEPNVDWHILLDRNIARPQAVFCLWIACHQRLAMKVRLRKFGVALDVNCYFCSDEESIEHMFFDCKSIQYIWKSILQWLRIERTPQQWHIEKAWITRYCSGKGKKCGIMKLALAETIYFCWKYRNDTCFGQSYDSNTFVNSIKDIIIHEGWYTRKYRDYIAQLLL
ncbi:uncharacterized protein LOC131657959 [Vicia villosa]|uniref:uncharacterized protein LOC131657959 n=1 Tax=Vicia villosa TaxID=3911 RepID=UPI00273C6449|nr:uncharacterized protein LOC131657959 [Vicia villosa]